MAYFFRMSANTIAVAAIIKRLCLSFKIPSTFDSVLATDESALLLEDAVLPFFNSQSAHPQSQDVDFLDSGSAMDF